MAKYGKRRVESIKSIKSKTIEELRRMDDITFKQTFTQVRDVARKRIKKLEELGAGNLIPALAKFNEGGGLPGWSSKKTREEQLIDLKRMLDFIKGKGTTKKDFEEYVEEIVRRFKEGGIDIEQETPAQTLALVNLANEAYRKAKERAPSYMKYVLFKEILALCEEGVITNAEDFAEWVAEWEDALLAGDLTLQNYRDSLEFNEV